jgi:hypothetical protein
MRNLFGSSTLQTEDNTNIRLRKEGRNEWLTRFGVVHNGGLRSGDAKPSGSITSVLANFSLNLHPVISHTASTCRCNAEVCKTYFSITGEKVEVTSWEASPCSNGILTSSVYNPIEIRLVVSVSSAYSVMLQTSRNVILQTKSRIAC